ncbi:hypothetical protein EV424DRAFT_1300315, partial [Suillus variegatus]
MIFAGDIGQLRPPKSNATYSYKLVKQLAPSISHTFRGQTALHGAFLWHQVDTVVELKKNWRAHEDAMFVALLERVRKGAPEEFQKFRDAPIVVTRKSLRDALNESKARQFALNTNQ